MILHFVITSNLTEGWSGREALLCQGFHEVQTPLASGIGFIDVEEQGTGYPILLVCSGVCELSSQATCQIQSLSKYESVHWVLVLTLQSCGQVSQTGLSQLTHFRKGWY